MKTPDFLIEWFKQMPYHQIAELTLWMDEQTNINAAIEKAIGDALKDDDAVPIASDYFELLAAREEFDFE